MDDQDQTSQDGAAQQPTPKYGSPAGQHPHVPGHDPLGSGMPRLPEPLQGFASATASPSDDTSGGDATGDDDAAPLLEEDAPLGGDENTEEQLTADTAVERDALKSLDPDDTPA
ncbi:hypothetical protein [Microbacterium sp. USHLN186]|uniref:hypothetical protein n=1 Tax=Microbacterium sp. USHLN186 TaxID=3081286 RepID=UPI003016D050